MDTLYTMYVHTLLVLYTIYPLSAGATVHAPASPPRRLPDRIAMILDGLDGYLGM